MTLLSFIAVVLLACGSAWADEKPPVFTDKKLDEVLAASKGTPKIVVAKATASWCAPCKVMDKTTWRDASVIKWFEENGIAVQFDVDADKDLAKRYSVRAMPTMIAFKDGVEFDRIVGGKQAPEFLAWLEGVKRGEKAGDALAKKREAGKMTGHERLNFARDLAQNGKNEEALKEYEWLWLNLLKQDPAMVGVRGSFMASDMTRLAEEYAPAKARFAELRDELEVKLKGKDKSWDDLGDWIVLNEIIDDQERTLAWIDRIKGDADAAATLNRFGFRLKPLLVEHGRFMDLGLIIRDPVREVSDSARMLKLHMEMQPNLKDIPPEFQKELREMPKKRFRDDVGLVYAAMLVSKREADAARVAAAGVKADDTGMMRSALVEWAIKAKVVGSDQQKLLDEAEEKGEDVKELRRQLNRLSGES